MEEDLIKTKNVEVEYSPEPDPLKTDVENFYFKEKIKKITFKPYKNLDSIEKQLNLDVQGKKTEQTIDELYDYFFSEPNTTPPIKIGFFKELYKTYNNILKINGQDPITSFEKFYSDVLKKGSEIYLNDKTKQTLIEKEIEDFNSKDIFNNIKADINSIINDINNLKKPVLTSAPKKPSDFPPKISNYKKNIEDIETADGYVQASYTNRIATLIDAKTSEPIYKKEGTDPDSYTDSLYKVIDNWKNFDLNNGIFDTDDKNYSSLIKSFTDSTKEDFYTIKIPSNMSKQYESLFIDYYSLPDNNPERLRHQKALFDEYYNWKLEAFKKMTTEFNFAYSGLFDTDNAAKKCMILGYRYFVSRPLLIGSADTNHCRMYDAYLNKVINPLKKIKDEFEDLVTNPTGSYQTFRKDVLAYKDVLDTYYLNTLPTYEKFQNLKGVLDAFIVFLNSLPKLKFFEFTIEESQIKTGYYIPTPNLEVKLIENYKANTYKKKETKLVFNFIKPELISFKNIGKPIKNQVGMGNYIPNDQQKLLNDYQPTQIIIHRVDKEFKNIETIAAPTKFYKELNFNTGFMFYENLEPNKDYYYFYYAFSPKYDSVPSQASKPLNAILNNFVNGMYTLADKNIKTLSEKLLNSFYIICSNVIKVKLVKDDNFYYLETKYITNDELSKKEYGKQFKEKFLIQPSDDFFELSDPKFENNKPYLKVRLKSKKTNKKIDFNIQYILRKDIKTIEGNKNDYNLLDINFISGKLKNLTDKILKGLKNKGSSLLLGEKLEIGEYLKSENGKYIFALQEGDGNSVLYDISKPTWEAIWSPQINIPSILKPFIILQNDGNLVYYIIYGGEIYAQWASTTAKNQINKQIVKLLLKNDGKLVLIDDSNNEVWTNGVYNQT